jgi:TrmH family RNA methyltransferase
MKHIHSRSNAQFKRMRSLVGSVRERRSQRRTVLDGAHLLATYLERVGRPELIAVSTAALGNAEIKGLLRKAGAAEVLALPATLFRQVSPAENPSGVAALIAIPPHQGRIDHGRFLVLLDRIQDPGNVGAIIRSAAGAGADAVILSPGCADPWAPKALRAAMGATFCLRIAFECELVDEMARFPGAVIATAVGRGVAPYSIDLTGPVAMLFGNEGQGLQAGLLERATANVSIPLTDGVESLGVSAAAAVLMFERVRQLHVASNAASSGARSRTASGKV